MVDFQGKFQNMPASSVFVKASVLCKKQLHRTLFSEYPQKFILK